MQENTHGSNSGSSARDNNSTPRFLEGADRVAVIVHGVDVAGLYGLQRRVGAVELPEREPLLLDLRTGARLNIYAAKQLIWTHTGMMRILQGVGVRDVFGARWILLNGVMTLPGDPQPGIILPILAEVLENPARQPHDELFRAAWQATRLST